MATDVVADVWRRRRSKAAYRGAGRECEGHRRHACRRGIAIARIREIGGLVERAVDPGFHVVVIVDVAVDTVAEGFGPKFLEAFVEIDADLAVVLIAAVAKGEH